MFHGRFKTWLLESIPVSKLYDKAFSGDIYLFTYIVENPSEGGGGAGKTPYTTCGGRRFTVSGSLISALLGAKLKTCTLMFSDLEVSV